MITHDAPYIDRRILLQAKSLVSNGYSVDIVYPFGEVNHDFQNVGINYKCIKQQLNSRNVISRLKGNIRKILPQKLYEKLKECYFKVAKTNFIDYESDLLQKSLEGNYDIFVAHDLPALPIAHKAAKTKNAKLVYDSHEFFTEQIALKGNRKTFFQKCEKNLIYDVDLIFTVNSDIANLFFQTYEIKDITILLNSIEEINCSNRKNLHSLLNIESSKKIILYQGGFLEDRNLETLVESAQYLDDNNILVMLGYSFLEDKLKKLASKRNILNKKVYFINRVPQKELLNYTAAATIGLIPYPAIDLNTKYCTPNKMFEYITAEIPIITNQKLVTVSKFLNQFNIGHHISFENPYIIADGINTIMKDLDINKSIKNIKTAKEALRWEKQEDILLKSYKYL
jgi:glycosyltransferase involved in cell wall biosynthesis